MSLLSLPPELRLRIYDFIPYLQAGNTVTISTSAPHLPAICYVNALLYTETLPIFTLNSLFSAQIDQNAAPTLNSWMDSLGQDCLYRVRSLLLSRHWSIPQPMRWEGHVGFYVRIERSKASGKGAISLSCSTDSFPSQWSDRFVNPLNTGPGSAWNVTTGTYPVSKDVRGLRLASVEFLAQVIRDYLMSRGSLEKVSHEHFEVGLNARDVHFINKAIDVVASHPISTHDISRQRSEIWTEMEMKMHALVAWTMLATEV